ncbi:Glucan endo-1,3-beta-glucosidase 8 [Platanthera zijinensis]|uniref:glucan endo-1,3-beta-D-glucosidase n=1 Tax=Platanthera zijinensis TaxID=2320716 RepID=A0AAP0BI63_9ASPA
MLTNLGPTNLWTVRQTKLSTENGFPPPFLPSFPRRSLPKIAFKIWLQRQAINKTELLPDQSNGIAHSRLPPTTPSASSPPHHGSPVGPPLHLLRLRHPLRRRRRRRLLPVGVNWGSQTSHPLNPGIVVRLLNDNGISKVKLFDADSWTLSALRHTGMDVMVGIPNDQLYAMSSKYDNAKNWVRENVTRYVHDGSLAIRYVAVGNEPFLTSYNSSFLGTTLPSLKNIQRALEESGLGDRIKAVVPLNADVYDSASGVPSGGLFRSNIRDLMADVVDFLRSKNSPFMVNIYPFLSLHDNKHFPVDFAFFDGTGQPIVDGGRRYTNVFDANFDTLVYALKKIGAGDMEIVVGEVGWPTEGADNANVASAERFYRGFLKKMAGNEGTPMRPGKMEVYLFGLIDEDMKSVLPGNFERHWGLFTYDGRPKLEMDLTGTGKSRGLTAAKGVEYQDSQWCVMRPGVNDMSTFAGNIDYACSMADCTPLAYGGSCNGLGDVKANASYAFNIYFQTQDQDVRACDFQGLAMITTRNASRKGCLFPVQIVSAGERGAVAGLMAAVIAAAVSLLMMGL